MQSAPRFRNVGGRTNRQRTNQQTANEPTDGESGRVRVNSAGLQMSDSGRCCALTSELLRTERIVMPTPTERIAILFCAVRSAPPDGRIARFEH